MKKHILFALCPLLGLTACNEDEAYVIQPPTIVSAAVDKTSFNYGDTINLTATLSDEAARLATLTVDILTGDRIIGTYEYPLSNQVEDNITLPVYIPLRGNLQPGEASLKLTLTNVLKKSTTQDITNLSVARPTFSILYAVTDDGQLIKLNSVSDNTLIAADLLLNTNGLSFKIAERLNADLTIDYTGLVLGDVNGRIEPVDENGTSIFAAAPGKDYITSLSFNTLSFTVSVTSENYQSNDWHIDNWGEATFGNEPFRTKVVNLVDGGTYHLFGELADKGLVYNPDFFTRTGNSVTYLGQSGEYTLYFNTERQNVLLLPGTEGKAPAYPDYLLITGGGIGAPSLVAGDKSTCWWKFDNVRDYLLCRKTAPDIYQVTMFVHGKNDSWVRFKIYENSSWAGEKGYGAFTWTGVQAFAGWDSGNIVPTSAEDGFYRLTIDYANKTIHVEQLTSL